MNFSDHVSDFDTCDGCGSGMNSFEANHRSVDPLYETVVLLQNIVEILDLSDRGEVPRPGEFQDHVNCHQTGQIGATFVDDHGFVAQKA